ncbi:MAG: FHA domain-containing protein, partial [Myxococcales bacterium]|nr:FHA domain-containing protein [Myxococcales bacterium]
MSRLRSTDGVREWLLPSRCLIGRSRSCDVVLGEPAVSSEHALLRWRNGAWELQDLHSRNGTYV